jgi:hypothetical protein
MCRPGGAYYDYRGMICTPGKDAFYDAKGTLVSLGQSFYDSQENLVQDGQAFYDGKGMLTKYYNR